MIKVSVLIITKNEEHDLPGCLESVSWCDDINVYDSMSVDLTAKIARDFGAKVIEKYYEDNSIAFGGDESEHRNWALRNIRFSYPWVFLIDADERMSPQLVASIKAAVESPGDNVAFSMRRRDFFMGKWLKHVQVSPFFVRLFRPEKMRYEKIINPVSVIDGPVGSISGYLDHYPFNKGFGYWVARHNSYSTFEAQQIVSHESDFSVYAAFFEPNFHIRRKHQKEIFYRLPLRPFVKFILLYFMKRGFLDGRAGFVYAILQSIYEYFIVLKVEELSVRGGKRSF